VVVVVVVVVAINLRIPGSQALKMFA